MRCVIAKLFGCEPLRTASQAARKAEAEAEILRGQVEHLERRNADLQATLSRREVVKPEPAAPKSDAEAARLREQVAALEKRDADLERRNAELREELSRKSAEAKAAPPPVAPQSTMKPSAPDAGYKNLALSLIRFRDDLSYFKDECEKEGNALAVKLLKNLYKETGRFMKANGVEPLEETGAFDADRQMVSSTAPTTDPAMNDTIAETFRAGYRIGGELHRPQEVVLYVYKE